MPGYSPALPLSLDPIDGIALNKTIADVAKQNLKMVVLTSPGERVMLPEFGAGVRNYLWQPLNQHTFSEINTAITQQVDFYLPYIDIIRVDIFQDEQQSNQKYNSISIRIDYMVESMSFKDSLTVSLATPELQ